MSVDPLRCTEGVQRLSLTGMLFFLEMVVLLINVVHDDRLQVHISSQEIRPRGRGPAEW
jgi:hypothetical protein